MRIADRALEEHAFRLCQELLRIDTTNPPGNERPAADLVAKEFRDAGLDPIVLESAPTRGNVVVRLKGNGKKRPLLLTGHLDVVEHDPGKWKHPAFAGEVHEGCLWGRGALDMKNFVAMSVAIITRLAREGAVPDRDIIFAGVADEEAGCKYGSLWLCENHRELVDAEYAIGEGGGFHISVAGKRFFTVQVAEKGVCWVKATFHGEPGHGSMPREDSAVIKMAEGIARLGKQGLPSHATPVVEEFLDAVSASQPKIVGTLLKRVLAGPLGPRVAKLLPDPSVRRGFTAMLKDYWNLGDPESDLARWKVVSPVWDIQALDTPLLMQLPESEVQSNVELHARLKRAGKPVEMFVFADELHIKYQPAHKRASYERTLDWYRFWLKGEEDPAPEKVEQYRRWRSLRAGQPLPAPAP